MIHNSKLLIVIRVDSSFEMGVGHLMRCLTLAENFSQHSVDIHFICRQHPGHLIELLQQKNYQVHTLVSSSTDNQAAHKDFRNQYDDWLNVSWQEDARQTRAVLHEISKVDWLIVDHYALNKSWEQKIRPYVSKIMVLDDLANREHDCDVLLDQTFARERKDYENLVSNDCHLLLGSDYGLIPTQFLRARKTALKRRELNAEVKNILVSMGGSDPNNVTQFVVDSIQQSNLDMRVDIVFGSRALHRDSVKACVDAGHSSNIKIHDNVTNFPEMMLDADLAIGAGGTTSWERCCLGLPTLMITTAENQIKIANELDRVGAVKYIGKAGQVGGSELVSSLQNFIDQPALLKKMSNIAANICDGYGAARVVMEFFPHYTNDGRMVRLRPANMNDAEIMLKWQLHPLTRKYARNPKPPIREEHTNWLSKRINSSDCIFNIILFEEVPVGVLRFDRISKKCNVFEISILVSPEHRQKGIAYSALKLGRKMFPNLEFCAAVHPENKASHDLFSASGYFYSGNTYVSKPSHRAGG